jgi:hypothetical protein
LGDVVEENAGDVVEENAKFVVSVFFGVGFYALNLAFFQFFTWVFQV